MDNQSPEFNGFKSETIQIGQEFQLFPQGNKAHITLDIEGMHEIPFDSEIMDNKNIPCTLLDTITPYEPTLGYQITTDDFDLEKRAAKIQNILQSKSIEKDLVLPLRDCSYITLSSDLSEDKFIQDKNYNWEYFERLHLIVQINKQTFIGVPQIDSDRASSPEGEVAHLYYNSFLPADLGTEFSWIDSLNNFPDKEGNTLNDFIENYNNGDASIEGHSFKLALPNNDKEKFNSIKARFVLSPKPLQPGEYVNEK